MSLSNILQRNNFNIYANSQTLESLPAQPVPGNNTLWINSANNHLYRDGVDLEQFNQSTARFFIPPTQFLWGTNPGSDDLGIDPDGFPILQLRDNTPDYEAGTALNPVPNYIPAGLRLTSFTLVYKNADALTDTFIILSSMQFTQGQPTSAVVVPTTGTFPIGATGVNIGLATFNVTNPVTLTPNQTLNISIAFGAGNPISMDIYGCYVDFALPN